MQLSLIAKPFDNPDWLFEWKADGFRALAYINDGSCKLVSRKDNTYKAFANLRDTFAKLKATAILDGEIVCLDEEGNSHFLPLLARKALGVVLCVRSVVAWRQRPAWIAPGPAEAATPNVAEESEAARRDLREPYRPSRDCAVPGNMSAGFRRNRMQTEGQHLLL
jgi:hypothetical protein